MVQTSSPPSVDVQAIMKEVRRRVRGDTREHEWARIARRSVPGHLSATVGRLRSSTAMLRSAVARIGELPPVPGTFRGRAGLVVVRILQRALFWYTPTVQNVNSQIVDALESHLKVTEEILEVLEKAHIELARISDGAHGEGRGA